MKKILFLFLIFSVIFTIYYLNTNKNICYVSLGDYLSNGVNNVNKKENGYSSIVKEYYGKKISYYLNYSTSDDYRVMDLINDITYNKTIIYKKKEYKIQNILIKANYITLSIGMNELIKKNIITYDYIDTLLDDINYLFNLIRKYNKDRIDFLSFYDIINNPELIEYTNDRLKRICNQNNINYIDISKLKNYVINYIYPTDEGYKYISNQIINFTK